MKPKRPPKPTTAKKSQTGRADGGGRDPFRARYPHIADWVEQDGWIEMGRDDFSRSFVRALDIGGMVWKGKPDYPSVDAALQALDDGIADWQQKNS